MSIKIEIKNTEGKLTQEFYCGGDRYYRGVGKWRVEPELGPLSHFIQISAIDAVAFPRNIRRLASIKPGESFTIVRPTASMTVTNKE